MTPLDLPSASAQRIRVRAAASTQAFLRSVPEMFAAATARAPDAVALSFRGEELTYGEVDERASRVAAHLRARGVGPGDLVALLMERSAAAVVAILGVLKAGAAYLPLDATYPRDRLAFMLEDARPALVLAQARTADRCPPASAPLLRVEEVLGAPAPAPTEPFLPPGPRDLAYVIYTSGSTGRPKGVLVEHGGVCNMAAEHARAFGVGPGSRVAQAASLSFDASVLETTIALLHGATLVVMDVERGLVGRGLFEQLREGGVDTLLCTPSALRTLPREPLPDLRALATGGEALGSDLVAAWGEGRRFFNCYGPTEATVAATFAVVDPSSSNPPPIGRPLANVRAYVLRDDGSPAAPGETGELYLGGVGVARGYLHRPELTAERFLPDPFSDEPGARMYRTGDLVRALPGGDLAFIGRTDDQVKIRGVRIELGEIEATLATHPDVAACAVVALPGPGGDARLVAYAVPRAPLARPAETLGAFLAERLPAAMLPSRFVLLDAIPFTPAGKLDRRALPPPPGDRPEMRTPYVAPRDARETLLATIWSEVLGVSPVGVRDGFVEMGGDSILAVQVAVRAAQGGLSLSPADVFVHGTVEALCACAASRAAPTPPPADAPAPFSLARLSPAQLDAIRARGDVEDVLPATPVQEGMLFHSLYEAGSAVYVEQAVFEMEGPLDAEAFAAAWRELVRRHPALRASFAWAGLPAPHQVVHAAADLPFRIVDLARLADADARERVDALARDAMAEGFDLTRAPLLRVDLARTAPDRHALVWTFHHLVLDGWSVTQLLDELKGCYAAVCSGAPMPPSLAPPPAAYLAWLAAQDASAAEPFWRDALRGRAAPTSLAPLRPRGTARAGAGASHEERRLAPDALRALERASRAHGLTLGTMLEGAWAFVLSRLAGEEDVLFGVTVAGRPADLPGADAMVGLFINTLPARVGVPPDAPAAAWLGALQRQLAQARAFEHSALTDIQGWSDVPRGTPLVESVVVVERFPREASWEIDGMRLRLRLVRVREATNYPVMLVATPDEGLHLRLAYDAARLDADAARRILAHVERVLLAFAQRPDGRLAEVPLVAEGAERDQVLAWGRAPAREAPDRTIHAIFEEVARARPSAVALEAADGARWTYADLSARSDRIARGLRALGVGPGAPPVSLCMERGPGAVAAMLGILKAGGAYLPLDPSYPRERLAFMVEDAAARVLVAQETLAAAVPRHERVLLVDPQLGLVDEDDGAAAAAAAARPAPAAAPEGPAYVMYTSGSTGKPKGVLVPHRGVVRLVRGQDYVDLGPDDVLLQAAPLSFDASTFEIWGALLHGGRLALLPPGKASLAELGAAIRGRRVTTLWLTAPLFHQMVDHHLDDLRGLRQLLAGGDVLSPAHVARFRAEAPSCRLVNGYGPTENTTFTCCHVVDEAPRGSVPIGRPVRGTTVYVLDPLGRLAPAGAPGELHAGGDGLALGYLHRPDLTSERFLPDPFSDEPGARMYRTGDLVRWLPSGELEFLGRIDQQVKVRGFRVELGEIEAALLAHPDVDKAAALARPDAHGDKTLVAYLVPRPGAALDRARLHRFLAERLAEHALPSAVVVLDALPLTSSGKIDRRALPAPHAATALALAPDVEFVAPRNTVEETLAEIWKGVLGVPRVGARDHFLHLGGHSLKATQVVSRIRDAFGVDLPLRDFFADPTLEGVARGVVEQALAPLLEIDEAEAERLVAQERQV